MGKKEPAAILPATSLRNELICLQTLRSLPAMPALSSLIYLELFHGCLNEFPASLAEGLKRVITLVLPHNKFLWLPSGLSKLTNLIT